MQNEQNFKDDLNYVNLKAKFNHELNVWKLAHRGHILTDVTIEGLTKKVGLFEYDPNVR
jgi:hypothetical protein